MRGREKSTRFLVIRRAPDAEADSAVVVTNWTAVLRKAR